MNNPNKNKTKRDITKEQWITSMAKLLMSKCGYDKKIAYEVAECSANEMCSYEDGLSPENAVYEEISAGY